MFSQLRLAISRCSLAPTFPSPLSSNPHAPDTLLHPPLFRSHRSEPLLRGREHPSQRPARTNRRIHLPGGRITASNCTLKMLIEVAFDLQQFQISGRSSSTTPRDRAKTERARHINVTGRVSEPIRSVRPGSISLGGVDSGSARTSTRMSSVFVVLVCVLVRAFR